MREDLGLVWGIGIPRHFTDCFDPEARVRTTAYERMCESPVRNPKQSLKKRIVVRRAIPGVGTNNLLAGVDGARRFNQGHPGRSQFAL